MTADNAPVLIVVLSMFATFMAVVGAVSIWTNLPPKTDGRTPSSAR